MLTYADPPVPGSYKKFHSFWIMSEDKILIIVKSTPNKSCELDPIPTSLVCDCICILLTPNTLNNYLPVSSLSYISKPIEKPVCLCSGEYMEHKSVYFSLYCNHIAKTQNDIATSMDKGATAVLVLWDLPSAFDTIHHSILFDCLQH